MREAMEGKSRKFCHTTDYTAMEFILRREGSKGNIPVIRQLITIGRADTCTITLNSKKVSRNQCEIISRDGQIYIRDKKSSNGTYLNSQRITEERKVEVGDLIGFGTCPYPLRQYEPHQFVFSLQKYHCSDTIELSDGEEENCALVDKNCNRVSGATASAAIKSEGSDVAKSDHNYTLAPDDNLLRDEMASDFTMELEMDFKEEVDAGGDRKDEGECTVIGNYEKYGRLDKQALEMLFDDEASMCCEKNNSVDVTKIIERLNDDSEMGAVDFQDIDRLLMTLTGDGHENARNQETTPKNLDSPSRNLGSPSRNLGTTPATTRDQSYPSKTQDTTPTTTRNQGNSSKIQDITPRNQCHPPRTQDSTPRNQGYPSRIQDTTLRKQGYPSRIEDRTPRNTGATQRILGYTPRNLGFTPRTQDATTTAPRNLGNTSRNLGNTPRTQDATTTVPRNLGNIPRTQDATTTSPRNLGNTLRNLGNPSKSQESSARKEKKSTRLQNRSADQAKDQSKSTITQKPAPEIKDLDKPSTVKQKISLRPRRESTAEITPKINLRLRKRQMSYEVVDVYEIPDEDEPFVPKRFKSKRSSQGDQDQSLKKLRRQSLDTKVEDKENSDEKSAEDQEIPQVEVTTRLRSRRLSQHNKVEPTVELKPPQKSQINLRSKQTHSKDHITDKKIKLFDEVDLGSIADICRNFSIKVARINTYETNLHRIDKRATNKRGGTSFHVKESPGTLRRSRRLSVDVTKDEDDKSLKELQNELKSNARYYRNIEDTEDDDPFIAMYKKIETSPTKVPTSCTILKHLLLSSKDTGGSAEITSNEISDGKCNEITDSDEIKCDKSDLEQIVVKEGYELEVVEELDNKRAREHENKCCSDKSDGERKTKPINNHVKCKTSVKPTIRKVKNLRVRRQILQSKFVRSLQSSVKIRSKARKVVNDKNKEGSGGKVEGKLKEIEGEGVKGQEPRVENQGAEVKNQELIVKNKELTVKNKDHFVKNQGQEGKYQGLEVKNLEPRVKSQELKNQEPGLKNQEPGVKIQETGLKNQEPGVKNLELEPTNKGLGVRNHEGDIKNQGLKPKIQAVGLELEVKNLKPEVKGQELEAKSKGLGFKGLGPEVKNQGNQDKNLGLDVKNKGHEIRNQGLEIKKQEVEVKNQELGLKNIGLGFSSPGLEVISQGVKNKDPEVKNQELSVKNSEPEVKNQKFEVKNYELGLKNQVPRANSPVVNNKNFEPKSLSDHKEPMPKDLTHPKQPQNDEKSQEEKFKMADLKIPEFQPYKNSQDPDKMAATQTTQIPDKTDHTTAKNSLESDSDDEAFSDNDESDLDDTDRTPMQSFEEYNHMTASHWQVPWDDIEGRYASSEDEKIRKIVVVSRVNLIGKDRSILRVGGRRSVDRKRISFCNSVFVRTFIPDDDEDDVDWN